MNRSPSPPRNYSSLEVCDMTGATYRQLDYWARCGNLPDAPRGGPGSGRARRYTDDDVAVVRLLVALPRAGVDVTQLGHAIRTDRLVDLLDRIESAVAAARVGAVA